MTSSLEPRSSGPARPPAAASISAAERLIKVHAVASVVSLLVGAIAAVLLVLTRWQAVHLLPAEWFYRILGVHGMSMLIFFIIFFEMAVLYLREHRAAQRPADGAEDRRGSASG